jgi:RHS repeat-associated protein
MSHGKRQQAIFGVVIVVALALATATPAAAQTDDPMEALGNVPRHGSLSLVPWEHIDTYTGNAVLSFTDLVLPGNAGSTLAVQRVFNTKDATWRWLIAPQILYLGQYPFLVDANGNTQQLLRTGVSNVYRTTSLARVTIDTTESTLELPDGTVWYFPGQWGYATRMEDPFGNRVDVFYHPDFPWAVTHLVQHVGAQSRDVYLDYDDDGNPYALRYGARLWQYRWATFIHGTGAEFVNLAEVTPPEGASWTFEYTANTTWRSASPAGYPWFEGSITVHTPAGGWVHYSSANGVLAPEAQGANRDDRFLLRQRDAGGGGTAGGTWTFSYEDPANDTTWPDPGMRTTVTGPTGYTATYLHKKLFIPNFSNQDAPVHEITVGSETTSLEWRWSVDIGAAEPDTFNPTELELCARVVTTRDGHAFQREFTYADDFYNHFGQPTTILDTGDDISRTTTRTYRHFAGSRWLADRIETETIDGTPFASSYVYADTGFLMSRTVLGITTTFAPDAAGNVASQTDANNQETTFDYDWGVVNAVHTPAYTVSSVINPDGTTASTTQRGSTTSFTYDDLGRQKRIHPPLGNDTVTTYAPDGTSVTVPTGPSWTTTYLDGLGRATGTLNSQGVRTRVALDEWGRATYASYPYTTTDLGTSYEYDALGRVKKITNPDGSTVGYSYDGINVTITDEDGHQTTQVRQASGSPSNARLKSVTDPNGQTTTYDYNALGSLTSVTQPNPPGANVTREWHYNAGNQLEWQHQPESGTVNYTYDAVGNLASQTDAKNQTTTYTYDGNNRLTHITSPDPAYSTDITYDEANNRKHLANAYVTSDFDYDAANRLTQRTDLINGHTFVTGFTPDDNGNVSDVKYPSGNHVQYTYDSQNRITSVGDAARALTFATGIAYHPSGGIASYGSGDGVAHTVEYDGRYRPTRVTADGVLDLKYQQSDGQDGYDAVGNLKFLTDALRPAMSATFGYDDLDRLTSATGGGWGSLGYAYDALGNRVSHTQGGVESAYTGYTDGSKNRLTKIDGQTVFTYDDNGNLTGDASSAGGRTYTYTPTNMLATATVAGGSALYTYRYDGDTQRVLKTGSGTATYYVHGLGEVLSEFDEGLDGQQIWKVDYVYLGSRLLLAARTNNVLTVTESGAGHVARWDAQQGWIEWESGTWELFTTPTSVLLHATPTFPWTFHHWEGRCGTPDSGDPSKTTIYVDGFANCAAVFALPPAPYSFTIDLSNTAGGTVRWQEVGGSEHVCPTGCGGNYYTKPATVDILQVTPAWGWRFDGWTGCTLSGEPPSLTLDTGQEQVTCRANFARLNANDFNNNGTADIVWHNTSSGQNLVWYLVKADRAAYGGWDPLPSGLPEQRTVSTGDFNVDTYADIVWQTLGGTASHELWHMQLASYLDAAVLTPPDDPANPVVLTDPNWRIVGAADFNHDTKPDLVWRNAATGQNVVWFMNDTVATGFAVLTAVTDTNWRIVGVADFNSDGRPDLVWRNASTGENLIWFFDGTTVIGWDPLPACTDVNWWIVGVGDDDSDGHPDLLWRNLAASGADSGRILIWFFVGIDYAGWSELPVITDQTWVIGSGSEQGPTPGGGQGIVGGEMLPTVSTTDVPSNPSSGIIPTIPGVRQTLPPLVPSPMPPPVPSGLGHPAGPSVAPARHTSPAIGLSKTTQLHALPTSSTTLTTGATSTTTATTTGISTSALTGGGTSALDGEGNPPLDYQEYYHLDALGSVRAVTRVVNLHLVVVERHDFRPFGEEVSPPSPPATTRLFTGQERDFETGLDYFNARYLATAHGRFTVSDPGNAGARSEDPQSWNAYGYSRNNPLRFTDPSGLAYWDAPPFLPFPISTGSGTPTDPFIVPIVGDSGAELLTPAALTGTELPWSLGGLPTLQAEPAGTDNPEGGAAAGGNPGISGLAKSLLSKPWVFSWIVPLAPVPAIAGGGPAGTVAYNPQTRNLCVGLGGGASVGKNASLGPLLFGGSFTSTPWPSNADAILGGWSASGGANWLFPTPFAGIGYQVTANSSGVAHGPTLGVAGVSGSVTYSVCGKLF